MQNEVVNLAIKSRLLIYFIQYVSNTLIEDHDAKVFLYPQSNDVINKTVGDRTVDHLFGGFLRWDAQYFIHIAKYGYTYENTLAFFPLFPIMVKNLSHYVSTFVTFLTYDSLLLLSALLINFVCFVLAAKTLYTLSTKFFSENFSYKVAVLFCFNPASIFFSAPYTECLFCYLTFVSLLNCLRVYKIHLEKGYRLKFIDSISAISISLCCLTRSNGLLNIGFLCYTYICILLNKKFLNKMHYLKFVIHILLNLSICLSLFIAFQVYCYDQFCTSFISAFPQHIYEHALENSFILPGQFFKYNQSWCYNTLPLAYSYVQNHYWEVGLFQYYQFKNIPHFALALPVVYLITTYSLKFFNTNIKFDKNIIRNLFVINLNCDKNDNVYKRELLVYVVHAFFLVIFCMLFIHVQVTTRMILSANPVIYWYSASILFVTSNNAEKFERNLNFLPPMRNKLSKFVFTYYLMYFFVGTVLFCNFLPWT